VGGTTTRQALKLPGWLVRFRTQKGNTMPNTKTKNRIPPWVRIVRDPRAYHRKLSRAPKIDDPERVFRLLSRRLSAEEVEIMVALVLTPDLRLLGAQEISRGGADYAETRPREVFRSAILLGGVAIILAHNHPGGHPQPSKQDVAFTVKMKTVGELIGIRVLDHVVIGSSPNGPRFISMNQRKLVDFVKNNGEALGKVPGVTSAGINSL